MTSLCSTTRKLAAHGFPDRKAMHFPHRLLENRKNKICVQQKVVTLTRFVYQDNLYKLIQNVYILKSI